MRNKNIAGLLALLFGTFGVHRFYLGQKGLGVMYCVFFFTGITAIVGFIDALVFFSMDEERFDDKYNASYLNRSRKADSTFDRRRRHREREIDKWERRQRNRRTPDDNRMRSAQRKRPQPQARTNRTPTTPPPKQNPYKTNGVKKYKDYDFEGAIVDFKKALEIDEKDIATHFNLACAYSLNESVQNAFKHLDRAVALGFNDFDKIKQHDALAYLRIQPQYDNFVQQGFRITQELGEPQADLLSTSKSSGDLLEQLKKLGELRERGLLTEAEFTIQKKKLLG